MLSSCSLFQARDERESLLPAPLSPSLGPARRIVQEIKAKWSGKQETLLCILELDARHIALAGLTKEGISLFNLNFDGNQITLTKSPMMPDKLPPELIVKDLQWVFWPVAVLQKSLPKSWRLTAETNSRRLYFGEESVAEIHYMIPDKTWPKSAVLTNHRYGYRLEINTLSYDALPE